MKDFDSVLEETENLLAKLQNPNNTLEESIKIYNEGINKSLSLLNKLKIEQKKIEQEKINQDK